MPSLPNLKPGAGGGRAPREEPALTQQRRLGERMTLHSAVGIGLGILIVVGALVARYVVRIQEDFEVWALVALGLVIVVYHTLAWRATRHYRAPQASLDAQPQLLRIKYGTIILDYVTLTLAIWFVGGTRSPFLAFYVLHVILSCLLLSRRAALTLHWIAYGILVVFVLGEVTGIAPAPHMPEGAVPGTGPLDWRYAVTVLVVYGLLFGLTAFMLLGLARTLRQGERRLRSANEELERLSSMRRDFLRIALHNLQAPIGVVTMFLNNFRAGLGGHVTEQQADWIERSLGRLRGVSAFMHDLQMLSTLESGRIQTRAESVDVAEMLTALVKDHQDLAGQSHHELTLDLPQDLPPVEGIRLLIREAVVNYITNAVKYTPAGGRIVVRARRVAEGLRIEVQDSGVGIAPPDQARLFSEFVRIQDSQTARKAKGTGLGLSIVRHVAEAHGGEVGVESAPGKGSTFFLVLPAAEAA